MVTITITHFSLILNDKIQDTEELEKYRLERKRERNRIAATKCRYEDKF